MAGDVQEASASSSQKALDADQIQNLINMALSDAYDTVSSWLQPPSAAVLAADEKLRMSNQEFEKMAFRPARIGVGAEPPTALTAKEVYKLKHKLAGTKRKADDMVGANGKGKATQTAGEDEDHEESKSQSVSKKPKLDGTSALLAFEPTEPTTKRKKKKKKKDKKRLDPSLGTAAPPENDVALLPSAAVGPSSSVPMAETSASRQELEKGGVPEMSDNGSREERNGLMPERTDAPAAAPEALPPAVREKKKRKKKKKKQKPASEEQDKKSEPQAGVDGGGDNDKGQGRAGDDVDGDEWSGIPPSRPPRKSDMGLPPKPSKSAIYRARRPKPDGFRFRPPPFPPHSGHIDSPMRQEWPTVEQRNAGRPSIGNSPWTLPYGDPSPPPKKVTKPLDLSVNTQPRDERTGEHPQSSTSRSLPTPPNGDSSLPPKKRAVKRLDFSSSSSTSR
ncbi:hypothetical protein FRC04_000299 [Tulasnella sp. 424]|nr:hypothetical protein FRC04_000299 [Tulasnella sp. 424]KAG8982162.1 hypothetical protein FRC05_000304 [Tulasnella sp. 425]